MWGLFLWGEGTSGLGGSVSRLVRECAEIPAAFPGLELSPNQLWDGLAQGTALPSVHPKFLQPLCV